MNKIVVIDKATSNAVTLETANISLEKVSVVYTKLNKDNVAEFIQQGNTLILKLKNGETISIENFFVQNEQGQSSDLVFEDDDGKVWWFEWENGVAYFKEIAGLEALLPISESIFSGMSPWLLGGGAVLLGGAAAGGGSGSGSGSSSSSHDASPQPISKAPIFNIGNGDKYINSTEITNNKVTVNVDVSKAQVGDTLIIDDGQNQQKFGPLTAQDIQNGVQVEVDAPANGQGLNITGTIQDATGQDMGSVTETYTVDTTSPVAPLVTIGDGDAYINGSEILNGKVYANVDLTKSAAIGDTLIVTDGKTTQQFGPLTAQQIQDGILVGFDAPNEGKPLQITATLTDPAGNVSGPTIKTATVDTIAPDAPSVKITSGDGYITETEISSGKVEVKVDIPASSKAGDILVISDGKTPPINKTLTAQDIKNGVVIKFDAPKEGEQLKVEATITDPAGNVSTSTIKNSVVDTIAPTVKVELQNNGTVKFIFSEAVKGFTEQDITVSNGSISGLKQESPNVWVANLTRSDQNSSDKISTEVIVEVKPSSYTDLADHVGSMGKDVSYIELRDDTYNLVTGLKGTYYGYQESTTNPNLTELSMVENFIAKNDPTASFNATVIDYNLPTGNLGGPGNLEAFLKVDKSSLDKVSGSNGYQITSDAIIKFTGLLNLKAGSYSFRVNADDGYKVTLNGVVVVKKDQNQSATVDEYKFTITPEQAGMQNLEILYWDQGGQAKLLIELDNGNGYKVLGSAGDQFYQDNPLVGLADQKLVIDQADLFSNDHGAGLKIESITNVQNGTATLENGKVTFVPKTGFVGDASFDYVVNDGKGGQATATVHVKFDNSTGSANSASMAMKSSLSSHDDLIYKVLSQDYEWDTSKDNNISAEFDVHSNETLLDIKNLIIDGSSDTSIDNYLTVKHEGSDTVVYLDRNGKDTSGYEGDYNVGEKLLTLVNAPANLTLDDLSNHINYL